MKVRFKMDTFIQSLQSVPEFPIGEEEKKKEEQHEKFMRVVFDSSDLSQIEDISTEELIAMLPEVDHYFGGETPVGLRKRNMVKAVFDLKGHFPSRVL